MSQAINILLVDDEARNLDALEAILSSPDYRLWRAQSADEALLALLQQDFAVIVLDIRMPDINGFELAQMIKQRKKNQHIPIIFLTAYLQDEKDVLEGYGAGAVDYLSKPLNPQILRSKVEVFVDLFRKTRELARLNEKMESEIEDRVAQVRAALQEKEILLKEVHHRVKNNLQIIQSLLRLGSRDLGPDQQEPFESAIRRVGAMALVVGMLYQSPDLASIDFRDYLRDVVQETAEAFGAETRGIATALDAEPMRVPLDTAVPLAFITVEILTNAFKHAFPAGRSGTVAVRCRQEDGMGILTISDSGVGIPKERAGSRRPLGLTLVHKLVEQIGGSLETPAPGGSRYEVSFPLVPHQQATVLPPAPRS